MLSRHVLTASDFQILIKSCSIESRNDPSPNSEVVHEIKFSLKVSYATHACLVQLDRHQTCKPVMISCEFNSYWRQLIFKSTELVKYFCHKSIRTCYSLCRKPGYYHSARKTHLTEEIFKLIPIRASVISQIR